MSIRICPICQKQVQVNVHSIKPDCGHYMHGKCMDQSNPDFERCVPNCEGRGKETSEEPFTYNGHDYVANPVAPSLLGSILTRGCAWKALLSKGSKKTTIQSLIADYEYGLQRLLAEGVGISDFLDNGYTWEHLKGFRDFQTRVPETLFALRCTAEHLRDYPHALPVKEMGITPQNIVEYLGFCFVDHENQPTVVDGNNTRTWTAAHIADLGMTFSDLCNANLKYVEQYESLMSSDEDDARLGVGMTTLDVLADRSPDPTPNHIVVVEKEERKPEPQVIFAMHAQLAEKPTWRKPMRRGFKLRNN